MPPCSACLASTSRAVRSPHRSLSTWFSFRQPTRESPVASTSRLPGAPLNVKAEALPPRRHGKSPAGPFSPPQAPSWPSTNHLKTKMIRSLRTRKPREAYQLLLSSLADPRQPLAPKQALGLVHLFFTYNKPELAVEAVLKLHERGFRIPPSIAIKLLQSAYHEIALDPIKLATVVGWLKDGVMKEGSAEAMNAELVLTVMSLLKRLGHAEWAMNIFEAWMEGLLGGRAGPAMVWSQAISVLASVDDVVGAREVFMEWRRRWGIEQGLSTSAGSSEPTSTTSKPSTVPSDSPYTPPEQPYTTLLNFLASRTSSVPSKRDPIIPIISLIKRDNLPLSLGLFHTLLRIEVHRKRFASFWGLWRKLAEGGWQRSHISWSLAIKALTISSSMQRRRARKYGSPLQSLLPETYTDSRGPKSRELYREFLEDHQAATGGRPSLELAKQTHAVSSTATLNRFLSLFIDRGDWSAAAVVLETFGVHHIEPNEATHGDVVVGVVRHWEKGKLRGSLAEEEGLLSDEMSARRMKRRAGQLGGPLGGQLISRILEQRDFRVKLFVDSDSGERVTLTQQPPPAWMLQRERREMGYLFSLLRRAEGMDELRWKEEMAVAIAIDSRAKRSEDVSAPEARAELYRDIALHHDWSGAAKGSLHASSSKLLNTLKESGLGSHCRRLDVSCYRAKSVSHAEDVAEQAFRACTNITTLVLTFPSLYHGDPWIPDPAPRSIRIENLLRCVVQQLMSLETSNISWGKEMVDIVGASTSIKLLSVEDVLDGAASPSAALKLKTYQGAGMLQSDTMSALLASSQPTLRRLFLTEESLPPGRVLNLSPYTALRSVYLSCDLDSDETQLCNVIKSLKSATLLQEFTLSHSLAAETEHPGDLNSLDLLRLVPSSVTRLRLICLSLGTQYLLDALSDSPSVGVWHGRRLAT